MTYPKNFYLSEYIRHLQHKMTARVGIYFEYVYSFMYFLFVFSIFCRHILLLSLLFSKSPEMCLQIARNCCSFDQIPLCISK